MKQLHYYIVIVFACAGITFSSCVEDIDLPLENASKMLVVEASLTTDTMVHRVKLSLSSDFYNQSPPVPITGAIVTVAEGENSWQLTETGNTGIYETAPDFYILPEKTYILEISNVDIDGDGVMENYWAESTCYDINPVDAVEVKKHFRDSEDAYIVYLYMQDNPATKDNYMGTLYINDKLVTDSIDEYFFTNDMLFNGNYISGSYPIFTLDQEKEDEILHDGDKLTMYMYGIPSDYFDFVMDLQNVSSSNPFMGSPANPRTNIYPKNKACGYFYVASVHKVSTIYKKE